MKKKRTDKLWYNHMLEYNTQHANEPLTGSLYIMVRC